MTSLPVSHEERKRLGAWYTTENLVRPLVNWAIRSARDRVMDPSCGDGAFLLASAGRLREFHSRSSRAHLFGFDLSQRAIEVSHAGLAESGWEPTSQTLRTADFFTAHPPLDVESSTAAVDAIVGNPPYIRYQSFSGRVRALAVSRCKHLGVDMGGLASSWAPFVVHASSFLRKGGRLALVLPEEMVHANYAGPVRKYLRENFQRTAIISFEQHLFPETQERVVLLAADGYLCSPTGTLQIRRLKDPTELEDVEAALVGADVFPPGDDTAEKWQPGARDECHQILRQLESSGLFVRLSSLGKAGIGYVSGANDFFVLSSERARAKQIPPARLTPTLTAARHCAGAVVRVADMDSLVESNERVLLLVVGRNAGASVQEYLREGEAAGIPRRYKCRVREPWYTVPGVTTPDAFMTYMSDEGPRLALNEAGASCSNTLHAVRLHGVPQELRRAFAWSFYGSATQLSAELVGRPYGGGVLKLEPSEADRVLVPGERLLRLAASGPSLFREVDRGIRDRRRVEIESLVDELLLREHAGLSEADCRVLREALRALRARRLRAPRAESIRPQRIGRPRLAESA